MTEHNSGEWRVEKVEYLWRVYSGIVQDEYWLTAEEDAPRLAALLNSLQAKAELANEVGFSGYRHSKDWWRHWLARYDSLHPVTGGWSE